MSHSAYKDLNILHIWLNNQKSFVKHKKQLSSIYDKLDIKSEKSLGLMNQEPMLSEHVKENTRNFHKKERDNQIKKQNKDLYHKISTIHHRQNSLLRYEKDYKNLSPQFRHRSNIFRSIKSIEIEEKNEKLGKRIENKHPSYSFKKMEEDYKLKQYYKTLNRKFQLPNIVNTGKAVYYQLDTTVFQRTFSKENESKKISKMNINLEDNEIRLNTKNGDIDKKNSLSHQNFYKKEKNLILMRKYNKIKHIDVKPLTKLIKEPNDTSNVK